MNLRRVNEPLVIHYNAGKLSTNLMRDLPGYGPVWYYKGGIANILSSYLVGERFHIQYDNRTTDDFLVLKEDCGCRGSNQAQMDYTTVTCQAWPVLF